MDPARSNKTRPRIDKTRLQKKKTTRRRPMRPMAWDSLLEGLLDEIEDGSSIVRLYAILLARALLAESGPQMRQTYEPQLEQLLEDGGSK
jgi:hypothetical protein